MRYPCEHYIDEFLQSQFDVLEATGDFLAIACRYESISDILAGKITAITHFSNLLISLSLQKNVEQFIDEQGKIIGFILPKVELYYLLDTIRLVKETPAYPLIQQESKARKAALLLENYLTRLYTNKEEPGYSQWVWPPLSGDVLAKLSDSNLNREKYTARPNHGVVYSMTAAVALAYFLQLIKKHDPDYSGKDFLEDSYSSLEYLLIGMMCTVVGRENECSWETVSPELYQAIAQMMLKYKSPISDPGAFVTAFENEELQGEDNFLPAEVEQIQEYIRQRAHSRRTYLRYRLQSQFIFQKIINALLAHKQDNDEDISVWQPSTNNMENAFLQDIAFAVRHMGGFSGQKLDPLGKNHRRYYLTWLFSSVHQALLNRCYTLDHKKNAAECFDVLVAEMHCASNDQAKKDIILWHLYLASLQEKTGERILTRILADGLFVAYNTNYHPTRFLRCNNSVSACIDELMSIKAPLKYQLADNPLVRFIKKSLPQPVHSRAMLFHVQWHVVMYFSSPQSAEQFRTVLSQYPFLVSVDMKDLIRKGEKIFLLQEHYQHLLHLLHYEKAFVAQELQKESSAALLQGDCYLPEAILRMQNGQIIAKVFSQNVLDYFIYQLKNPGEARVIRSGLLDKDSMLHQPVGARHHMLLPRKGLINLPQHSPQHFLAYPPITTPESADYWAHHFEADIQGLPKNTIFTTAVSGSIISAQYCTQFYPQKNAIGLLFNSLLVNDFNQEFAWYHNALTNTAWMKGDITHDEGRFKALASLPHALGIAKPCRFDDLAFTRVPIHPVYEWNEILFAPSIYSLVALFSPEDNLLARLELFHYADYLYQQQKISLPLVIINDKTSTRRLYKENDILSDLKTLWKMVRTRSSFTEEDSRRIIALFNTIKNQQISSMAKLKQEIRFWLFDEFLNNALNKHIFGGSKYSRDFLSCWHCKKPVEKEQFIALKLAWDDFSIFTNDKILTFIAKLPTNDSTRKAFCHTMHEQLANLSIRSLQTETFEKLRSLLTWAKVLKLSLTAILNPPLGYPSVLAEAIFAENSAAVAWLIHEGVNCRQTYFIKSSCTTPINTAIFTKNIPIIELLLAAGAELNNPDRTRLLSWLESLWLKKNDAKEQREFLEFFSANYPVLCQSINAKELFAPSLQELSDWNREVSPKVDGRLTLYKDGDNRLTLEKSSYPVHFFAKQDAHSLPAVKRMQTDIPHRPLFL